MSLQLDSLLPALPADTRILDAGGWFNPHPAATHMADLMPYETRRGVVTCTPQPGERFTKSTWVQADFLDPRLHLPFADRFFAFSLCTHTLEDLADPEPLLRELRRVSCAGYIETPSRLYEQTIGRRDRMSAKPGQGHHHWIVEKTPEGRLVFFSKADSLDRHPGAGVPLTIAERLARKDETRLVCALAWRDTFAWEVVRGAAARECAAEFTRGLTISFRDRAIDGALRVLRRLRYHRDQHYDREIHLWWEKMLVLSHPYSSLPLR
jgi:SAM-dependent methyltransferase